MARRLEEQHHGLGKMPGCRMVMLPGDLGRAFLCMTEELSRLHPWRSATTIKEWSVARVLRRALGIIQRPQGSPDRGNMNELLYQ